MLRPQVSRNARLRSAAASVSAAQVPKAAMYASTEYTREASARAPVQRASSKAPIGAWVSAVPRNPPRLTTATATPARGGGVNLRTVGPVRTDALPAGPLAGK